MRKQQYIIILEAVVLRSPDKIQEFSLQLKTINTSAVSFQGFCLHFPSFCFQEQVGIASFIRNFKFFDYPVNKYMFKGNNSKTRER